MSPIIRPVIIEEPIAPIIESGAHNNALLASHNPAEALRRIRYLVDEARDQHRIGDRTKVMVALNKIAELTGMP
jgi:hypothetical protein